MSTKFRQSFILLCDDCRRSSRGQRSDAALFCKQHTVRHVMGVHGLAGGHTISTTGKISYHQHNGCQFQEKKSLLADNTRIPIAESPVDDGKSVIS